MIGGKNTKLTELQLYINNILGCLGILDLLSVRRKIISETISSTALLFLEVYYLQIKSTFNKPMIFK